ncbi:hypothetical protein NESM_000506900 [Novymonas esmeraldas]|uniref:E3 ubiquitin-protein ligase listerin n=1 Tax=Novymonas esmeraldas TaxID=1808958 RepID=A0AAW0ENJ3_9TRYP
MPRAARASQSEAARVMVSSTGAPAGLTSFLGGFATGVEGRTAAEDEGDYVVQLRLLNKTSEITKQKAFDRLLEVIQRTSSATLAPFASATVEAVIQHAQHVKPAIRASAYHLLAAWMRKDKALKVAVVPELKVLAGVWVMGMNDMEVPVCHAATAAFDAAFVAEKKALMLQQFMDPILVTLRTAVEEVVSVKKPLADDSLDPNANKLFAALKAMGFMMKQVSAAQSAVLKVVQDPALLGVLLPPRTAPKSYLLLKTPLARSAVLALLRDVVVVCPATVRIHQLVSHAVFGCVLDAHVAVASRTWELLLFWCRSNVADVVSHMHVGFLDDVVNSFMACQQAELAEVIFPCLLPLLTSLSKDARCEGILDEFCAALVERLSTMKDTPNVSARELEVVLTAAAECWELHCVRKTASRASADSVELFTVICFNAVELMQSEAKATRYRAAVIGVLARSLLRTAARCDDVFHQCLGVLAVQPGAAFRVLPAAPEPAAQRCFALFQGRLLGRMCAATSPAGRTDGAGTANSKALVADVASAWLQEQVSATDSTEHTWTVLAAFFEEVRDTAFVPADAAADAVLDGLCATVRGTCVAASPSSSEAGKAALAAVVLAALEWRHRPAAAALVEATSSTQEHTLKEAALRHVMRDPVKLCDVLTRAIVECDSAGVSQCVAAYVERGLLLSKEQRGGVLEALRVAVADTQAMVTASGTDSDTAGSSASSASTASASDAERSESTTSGSSGRSRGAAGAADSSSASSRSSSSSSSRSDGDANGADADGAGEADVGNRAATVRDRVVAWSRLLRRGSAVADLLTLDTAYVVAQLLTPLSYISAAVATSVFVEQYISVKAMRVALEERRRREEEESDSDSDCDDDDGSEDPLADAMERKVHSLSIAECSAMAAEVQVLLDSYAVDAADRDAVATTLLRAVVIGDGDVPLPFLATYRLSQLVPLASTDCVRCFVMTELPWQRSAVAVRAAALDGSDSAMHLYDGYLTLDALSPTFTTTVRTAQLVRLLESVDVAASAAAMARTDAKAAARLFCQVLRVAAAREVLSDGVRRALFESTLPALLACVDVVDVAVEVAALVTATGAGSVAGVSVPYLLPTLAAVLRDTAPAEDTAFLRRAIRLVSAVASTAVSSLFHARGARGIAVELATAYTTFFAVLDEAADALRFNIAAQIPAEQERLLLEASCQLPMWDLTTAKLTLVLVRHLASLPAMADSTVKSLIAYAAKQTPLAGLELLAELSCTRIPTPEVYSELIRVIVDALCRCHRLRHLPPNGRLQRETGTTPASLATLRRIVVAAVLSRRGVVLHSRMDSVLRSTVNLVVFDAVCEAVSRLRATKPAEAAPLAQLIAFTSRFMGDLLTGDVMALRASQVSVDKIASVLCFAFAWLSATGIARLEQIGVATVAAVMRSVCLLANLTLMRATVPLAAPMQTIMQRLSLKPLREEYSTSQPAKVAQFRHHSKVLAKTHKHKMLLFPYLLSWCIYLTSAPPPPTEEAQGGGGGGGSGGGSRVARDKEWQRQVYGLLDVLFALMLTPMEQQATRLDATFIGASMHADAAGDTAATGQLGFEVVALTRVDAPAPMAQLARGSFAVFTQLLHGPTLAHVKSWLETVERKGRALFYAFVTQHVTGILIQESFLAVLGHSPDGSSSFSVGESCSVEVNVAQQLIHLSYEMEDARAAVRITFPPSFPLHPPAVEYESGRDCGVSLKKWRSWMLRMSVILFGGSANVWECIDLFHQNLEAHFRGIEPCPICFAVVSAVNHKLPDVRCSVCHNSAFHSNCLYTWWATGSHNVCPLCRSPWIAE